MAMTSSDDATVIQKQHKRPCHDCPFRRAALVGWLGGSTPEEYLRLAHTETVIDCHACVGPKGQALQCAGVAVYRANVLKSPPEGAIELPKDKANVFATPMEFLSHHAGKPVTVQDVTKAFVPPEFRSKGKKVKKRSKTKRVEIESPVILLERAIRAAIDQCAELKGMSEAAHHETVIEALDLIRMGSVMRLGELAEDEI